MFFNSLKTRQSRESQKRVRSFDAISKKVGSKSQEQVRQYYYRQLKRANQFLKLLGHEVDAKNQEATRKALLCYHNLISKSANPPKFRKEDIRRRFAQQLLAKVKQSSSKANPKRQPPAFSHPPAVATKVQPLRKDKENARMAIKEGSGAWVD